MKDKAAFVLEMFRDGYVYRHVSSVFIILRTILSIAYNKIYK